MSTQSSERQKILYLFYMTIKAKTDWRILEVTNGEGIGKGESGKQSEMHKS